MPRQLQQLNFNSFAGGIVTEASPLTFPDGASIDESNFELNKQGYRKRRLGLTSISAETELDNSEINPSDITTFLWENNGTTGRELVVVAVKDQILIYDVTDDIAGDLLVYSTTVDGDSPLSLTSKAGQLIVAGGAEEITIISSIGDNIFSERTERLYIRDRVGVPDYIRQASGSDRHVNMLDAAKANYRPTNDDLYLSEEYSGAGSTEDAEGITYTFSSMSSRYSYTDDDGYEVYRTSLYTSNDYDAFQGYPIEGFDVYMRDSDTPSYWFDIIFKDGFFHETITNITLTNATFSVTNGIVYRVSITEDEYSTFTTGTPSIVLQEQLDVNHPHIYNLWNQGFGEKRRIDSDSTTLFQPVERFASVAGYTPSNSDTVGSALYANTSYDNKTIARFHAADLNANPLGSTVAPQGHYIIDALNRGESRAEVFLEDLEEKEQTERTGKTQFTFESTSGGATTVATYAGRVWYGGFSGDTAGSTLKLSNKLLFSQISDGAITSCYQEADPTSTEDPDLVSTDGGWVSIDAVDEVISLVSTDTSLVVFATNGVWVVAGTDGNTFDPTSSIVSKITDKGALTPSSIVQVDSDLFYWSSDGLYRLASEGFASFKVVPMTKPVINTLVLGLTKEDFLGMSGAYDDRLDRILWIIDGAATAATRRELIYHIAFESFTINTFNKLSSDDEETEVMAVCRVPQFTVEDTTLSVYSGEDLVVDTDDSYVVMGATTSTGKDTRIAYPSIRNTSSGSYLFFADLQNESFLDWGDVDAEAYLLTGYITGGDTSRQKQVPYLTLHFNRTESAATEDGVEDESSCLVQSQWDWTNDSYSNKWGTAFQGYRLPRPQIRGTGEPVAEGIDVVTTNNKLRGRGRAVSLLFSTEEGKDCQILGWSLLAGINGNV